jgi:hypothetical protein
MKYLLPITALALAGCAGSTAIGDLTLPEPTTIHGRVQDVKGDTLYLQDKTGSIEVELEGFRLNSPLRKNEVITVVGVVDEDASINQPEPVIREFDAYSLTREDGREIKVVPYTENFSF